MKKRKVTLITGNGKPLHSKKVGRNELCLCGSGKKVKNCHNPETEYYTLKTKQEIEREIALREKEPVL